MRRRELIAAVAASSVLSAAFSRFAEVRAASAIIGLLSPFSLAETEPWNQAFRDGLRALGWTEGANARLEYRYADGRLERLPDLIAELINLKPDVLVVTVTPDALAAAKATKTIPIVMASTGDPVGTGLIASLSRPGGNVTGLTQIAPELAGKRLQLLKEVAPSLSRLAVLWSPADAVSTLTWREIQNPAQQLGIALHSLEVRSIDQFEAAFASAAKAKIEAITALPAPVFVVNAPRIAEFSRANRWPSIFHLPEFVHAGGLLSYGPDRSDLFRRAATYVDKILKGATPADLPVERPTKFQLVVNLKTAEAIGLKLPSGFLFRADEVIE